MRKKGIEKTAQLACRLPCLCGLPLHAQPRRGAQILILSSLVYTYHFTTLQSHRNLKPGSITPKAPEKRKSRGGKEIDRIASPSCHQRRRTDGEVNSMEPLA